MKSSILPLILLLTTISTNAQQHDGGYYSETLRGEVWVDLEPIYGGRPDAEYPVSRETAGRRALEEAAAFYAGMIYGWTFHYDVGERARGIAEEFNFEPMGAIAWGDDRLRITEVEARGARVRMWTDYEMSAIQQKRMGAWRMDMVRNAQGIGYCPLSGPSPDAGWLEIRNATLKDAARAAVRAMLRGSERSRPKEATGYISLASFPRIFIDSGQWVAVARFRVQLNEITPFAAY